MGRQKRLGSPNAVAETAPEQRSATPYEGKNIGSTSLKIAGALTPEIAESQAAVKEAVKTAVANVETKNQSGFWKGLGNFSYGLGVQVPVAISATASTQLLNVAEAIAEPQEAISVPDKVNWLSIASFLDEVLAMLPRTANLPAPSILQSMGYNRPVPIADVMTSKITTSINHLFSDDPNTKYKEEIAAIDTWRNNSVELFDQEAKLRPQITNIPLLTPAKEWWEGMSDGQPSWFLSKALHDSGDWTQKMGEDYGQLKTGSDAADYLLNGSVNLVGSIGASFLGGSGMAAGVLKGSKALRLAGNIKAARAVEKLGETAVAVSQTMGESLQVAKQTYDDIVAQRVYQIGGQEYADSENQAINDKMMQNITLPKEGESYDQEKADILKREAIKEHRDAWLKDHPKEAKVIEKNALIGYQSTIRTNTGNIFLNKLSASLYFRGRTPARNILTKPRIVDIEAVRAAHYEGLEEVVNYVAGKGGVAKGMGNEYSGSQMLDDVFSMESFGNYAWGAVGGLGESTLTNWNNKKARNNQFEEQQRIIAEQNKIGSSNMKSVHDMISIDESYAKVKGRMQVMQKMEAEGKVDEQKMVADQILAVQAMNAFKTGTTENLIKNYKQLSENKTLTPEVREHAKNAIAKIELHEKAYENSLRYQNSEDVFMNGINYSIISDQLLNAKNDYIQLINNELNEKLTLNDVYRHIDSTLAESTNVELKSKVTQLNEYIDNLIEKKNQIQDRGIELKSKTFQRSAAQERLFYRDLASVELDLRKANKRENKAPFDLYNSNEYEHAINDLLTKYRGKLTNETIEAIKSNYAYEKKTASIITKLTERAIINKAAQGQTKIAQAKGMSLDNAPEVDKNAAAAIRQIVDDSPDLFESEDPNVESNDPKKINDNITPEQQDQLKGLVEQLYGSLKNNNSNPTIEDLVRYYMTLKSAKQAENDLDAIVKGWKYAKLPGHEAITTDALFTKMFKDIASIADELAFFTETLPTDLSPQEQAKIDEETQKVEAETVLIQNKETEGHDKNGRLITNPSDRLDTANATLAHKSNAVVENYEEENGVTELTHKKINDDPNISQSAPHQNKLLFSDKIITGSELTVEVAEDFMEKEVKTYDSKGKPVKTMTFGQWLEARNAQLKKQNKPELTPDSQEYKDKIPMVVKDADGDIVALIHDVNRINEFHNTKGSIGEAQKNTRRIRNAAVKNGTKIKVTNKTLGHILPYLKDPVKLKDGDPTAILALSVAGGKLDFKREKSGINPQTEGDQIVYSEGHPRMGELYELRKIGVTKNGDPKFFAFKANRPASLAEDVQQGIYELIDLFINKDMNRAKFEHIASMLFARTKSEIDIRGNSVTNLKDLDAYLNQFVHITRAADVIGSFEHRVSKTIANIVEKKKRNSDSSFFMFTIDGKIVVGEAVAGNLTASLESIKIGQLSGKDEQISLQNDEFLSYLKFFVLPNMRVNVSKERLNTAVPVPLLKDGLWVNKGNSYNEFLRETFETTNPARKVTQTFDGEEKTEYISFVQPNLEVELVESNDIENEEYLNQINTNTLTDEIAKKIAKKIDNAEALTSQEEELKRIDPKKVESFLNTVKIEDNLSDGELFEVNGKFVTFAEYERITNEELDNNSGVDKYLNDDESLDPKKMTDEEINDIRASQHTIKGLFESDQRHIVEFIFNNVAGLVKMEKGKVVNIEQVRDEIKKVFKNYTENLKSEITTSRNERKTGYEKLIALKTKNLTDAAEIAAIEDKFNNFKLNYEKLDEKLNRLNIITKNWEIFEEQALNMSKKFFEIDNNKAVPNDPDDEAEDREETLEAEDSKSPEFDKTAEEVNHKEKVSAEVRIFCQGIEAKKVKKTVTKDENGEMVETEERVTITGTFGTPTYVGFDTIFDTVSQLLADLPSNKEILLQELERNKNAHNWIPDFIEKFKESSESLQNEIVRHMTKHALDMEFVMFSKNRDGSYSLKIYSTNSTAIIQNLKTRWKNNARNATIMNVNEDGDYIFNKAGINQVLREYEELKGNDTAIFAPSSLKDEMLKPVLERNIEEEGLTPKAFYDSVKGTTIKKLFLNHEEMARFLHFRDTSMLNDRNAKLVFKHAGKIFEMRQDGNANTLILKEYQQTKPSVAKLQSWLEHFGIEISEKTAFEILYDGFRYDKNTKIQFNKQWEGEDTGKGNSLLGVLAGTVKNISKKIDETKDDVIYDEQDIDGDKLLSQSIIDALAVMESKHTEHRIVQSFYDNKKVLYGYTISKYITDRVNALKRKDVTLFNDLKTTTYNKHSFWLDMMESDESFLDKFKVKHLGRTSLKEQGKKIYRDNDLQALSLIDHELVKLGMFMSLTQGDVKHNKEKYVGLKFRVARMFSPTMSDKSTATTIRTAVLDFDDRMMDSFENTLDFMYSQMVAPDIDRISAYHTNVKASNVNAYDKGARLFYGIPKLNNLKVPFGEGTVSLSTLLETKGLSYIESNPTIKGLIMAELNATILSEQEAKLKQWEDAKFITKGEDGKYNSFQYLDKFYINSRAKSGSIDEKLRVAAMDYVLNSMAANVNSMMVIAGDPAQYYKKEQKTSDNDYTQIVRDTFMNVGKRLANQIAPGDKLADSDVKGNTYLQLMMNDVFSISDNIHMIIKTLDNKQITQTELDDITELLKTKGDKAVKNKYGQKYPKAIDYLAIESTNAQEYTTWREHLYVLEKMGKSTDASINVTQEDIDEARKFLTAETKLEDLTDKQKVILNKIVQPMKPVYTGQIKDSQSDLMRTVYIKTSSFPLIPQLTAGMEIDKLRSAMETIERQKGKTVRASFSSGNKVGAIANPMNLGDATGRFNDIHELSADQLAKFTLELPRSGFRIQQNVPFKSGLTDEDIVTLGTQTVKLLFGNGVMGMSGFKYNGREFDGQKLHKEFFNNFNALVTEARNNLFSEIGIDPNTNKAAKGVSVASVHKKLSRILQSEAVLRGFPRQDIEALGIDVKTGDFKLPLWLSPNSVKYEALLMAIVSHRIAKIKFPGYSYVAGSENGFQIRTDEEFDIKKNGSQIVFTDAWTGKLKSHQALVQSKFRINGKLIDIVKDGYAKEVDGKWILDTDKISLDLLNLPSFRIPTSKHSSMENVEIAGFLPSNSADLMIVSKDGTVAMGEDYDVDKRFTYHLWTTVQDDKIIPLDQKKEYQDENYISQRLAALEEEIQTTRSAVRKYKNIERKIQELYDNTNIIAKEEGEVNDAKAELLFSKMEHDQIQEYIKGLVDEYKQLKEDKTKLIQNNIIRIHQAVLNHELVNNMMIQKLSVDEATQDAEFIEGITSEPDENFTPFSDRYQQQKVISGAAGKLGTAAYSLDVVGQSLFEQAHMNGNTLQLMQRDEEDSRITRPFNVRIGGIQSDGKIGQQFTFNIEDGVVKRNGRPIADVHSERQNLMVDNEKEQIAIRVHLNSYTMKIDKILNMLGFDKGEAIVMENGVARPARAGEFGDKYSVSFLFISQPVIKEFVKMMEAENSNTAEYDPKRKENIIAALMQKYQFNPEENINYDAEMTNANLVNALIDNGANKELQGAILAKFLQLEQYGDYLTSVQTSINIDSKGVGKKLFEVTEKINAIMNLFSTETETGGLIANSDKLVGDAYTTTDEQERDDMLKKGYILISKKNVGLLTTQYYMIQPNTVAGVYAINALVTANGLWSQFFPYSAPTVDKVFNEVFQLIGNSDLSEAKTVEVKGLIFNEIKKYIVTDQELDYFTMTPQEERFRLFFDSVKGKGDKKSLASFLKSQKDKQNVVGKLLRENRLINRLNIEINSNGQPSLIKLDNGIGQNFDETYIYDSLIELIDENMKLDDFNGKPYTTLNLAQDLVLYSYMEGGVQQAIQFIKYIPVSYIKKLGIDQLWNRETPNFDKKNLLDTKDNTTEISTFSKQFMQHNPQLAKRISPEDMKQGDNYQVVDQLEENNLNTLRLFKYSKLNEKGKHYPFVSIYNEKLPKGESKFQLYAYMKNQDDEGFVYVRIPVLGQFGMNEYAAKADGYVSLVNQPFFPYPRHKGSPLLNNADRQTKPFGRFGLENGNVKESLNTIAQLDTPIGKMAKFLVQALPADVKMQIADIDGRGSYKDGMITIDKQFFFDPKNSDEEIATTFVREAVHSIANQLIAEYVQKVDDKTREFHVKPNAPVYIKKLFALFAETQKHLNRNGELDALITKVGKIKSGSEDVKGLDEKEYNITYAGYNIYEFVERMLTSPELQKRMNEVEFKSSDKTLLDKFYEFLDSVLDTLAKQLGLTDLKRENITAQSFDAIHAMINEKIKKNNQIEKTINEVNELVKTGMTASEFERMKEQQDSRKTFDQIMDENGYIDDESLFNDPLLIANFDVMKAVTANMIRDGRIKLKCN